MPTKSGSYQNAETHNVIVHCFKASRISNSTDDSDEPGGGVAHSAVEAIATETVHLNSRDNDGDNLYASDNQTEFEANFYEEQDEAAAVR